MTVFGLPLHPLVVHATVVVGTLVQVVLIGHSGATAVWSGSPAAG